MVCKLCGVEVIDLGPSWTGPSRLGICKRCFFDKIWKEDIYPYIGKKSDTSVKAFIAACEGKEIK